MLCIQTALGSPFCCNSNLKMLKARSFLMDILAEKNEATSLLKSKSQDDLGNTELDVDKDNKNFFASAKKLKMKIQLGGRTVNKHLWHN